MKTLSSSDLQLRLNIAGSLSGSSGLSRLKACLVLRLWARNRDVQAVNWHAASIGCLSPKIGAQGVRAEAGKESGQ
jgi:hypothetical protein